MPNNENYSNVKIISELISDLCNIILTVDDHIDRNQTEIFIKELTEEGRDVMKSAMTKYSNRIDALLLKKVVEYIEIYQSSDMNNASALFIFDSASDFSDFIEFFNETYKNIIGEELPSVYNYIFNYVQEMSNHYRIFEKFYTVRSKETTITILSDAKIQAEQAVKEGVNKVADEAAQRATITIIANAKGAEERAEQAKKQAEKAKEQAEEARTQAVVAKEQAITAKQQATDAAEDAVTIAVDNKMVEVSSKVSENSVNILGIFAGIVLTIVAGLIYSSSVLDNVNSANFVRLMSVAALVGLVCYHLIALMFRSIEKIKNPNTDIPKINNIDKCISAVLIAIIFVFGFMQFFVSTKNEKDDVVEPTTSIYAEVDIDTKEHHTSSQSSQIDDMSSTSETASTDTKNESAETSTDSK